MNFLALVTERTEAAKLPVSQGIYCNAWEIAGVQLLEFTSIPADKADKINMLRSGLDQLLINTGFYFSYHFDLSVSRQMDSRRERQGNRSLMAEPEFIWNFEILKDFLYMGVSKKWLLPVIQGYVDCDH